MVLPLVAFDVVVSAAQAGAEVRRVHRSSCSF
jgi:hypothetical protein